ncbi:PREDICTED: uncharacterized protein KIAA0825 homolog [Priapulus caudatus]|uniref:Uncharacterized protein KIAA0825 homolog n=1 Tax=Priapulus caudatus TaxID=37621 RepID=A0ABM1EXD0_PRICU|nr:PREDICTED: uncharacterized protein KIAA0825 homolog [Priapulus caudatus]
MAIRTKRGGADITDLYRVFKKGFPNTKKEEEQGSRLVLSQESTTVEEERPVPHPAHWLSYIQPGVFIPYCSSVNQMQTTNVLYILLRLLDSQPQPNWSLLLQLLLFKDFTLPIMLLTLPADRLVAVETKPASCGGALCCGEECQSCSGQCANLFTPILHVLSLCYHLPEALAKVLEPVIDRANLWYLCDANVKPVELPELPPALQALYTLMEPFFNRVLEPGLRAVLCRSAIADSDAPNFWTPFSDLPCGCVNKQLFHHEDSKKDVLHVAIEAMLDAMVAALSTVPVSVCMFFARMQDLLRAHIQQPAHDSVGLQMLAAGLHYHLHIGSHLEKILGARINPAMQEKLNTLGECLYQLIIANPSSIRPRRPSEELAQGFILTRKDFLQSNIDSIKQFFGTFSLPKENFYHDAPQEFADELLANMAGEILEAPGGNQSMHWVYYLLKNNMTWLTSQLDIPSLYPHADTTGIVASFNNSALPPDVSTEFNPLKEINMIGTGVFDQDAIASMPYDWQQLLQSDLGLSEVAFRQLLFNRHDMQEAAYLEEQEKKPVKVLRSLYEKDALELA